MDGQNQTNSGTGKQTPREIRSKVMRETDRFAYIMTEVNNEIMLSIIVDKKRRAVVGVGTSRQQAFEDAWSNADKELEKELEALDLL